jgi:hypothetical protein
LLNDDVSVPPQIPDSFGAMVHEQPIVVFAVNAVSPSTTSLLRDENAVNACYKYPGCASPKININQAIDLHNRSISTLHILISRSIKIFLRQVAEVLI